MKVAILTMFNGLDEYYSLVDVVSDQIKMLLDNNVDIKVIVSDNCPDCDRKGIYLDERIEWVKISTTNNNVKIKQIDYEATGEKIGSQFNSDANYLAEQFAETLNDCDICILHDILYLNINYIYNVALRKAVKKLPQVRFLSFVHSFPQKRPLQLTAENMARFLPMANTLYIYPSQSGIPALAKQYDVPESLCRVVYNTTPLIAECCKEVQKLHKDVNLLDTDILVVYPARFCIAKRFEKVAALCGCIKTKGRKSIKIIFCDAPGYSDDISEYKKTVFTIGQFYGLSMNEIIFTSDLGYSKGFPRQGILDLFSLSNLFICPSFSESFSITTLEAAQKGNFLILNENVDALKEIGQQLGAYFMKWDAVKEDYRYEQHYEKGEKKYYEDNVPIILKQMRTSPLFNAKTKLRTRFNSQWVWENQLCPLLSKKI